MNITKKILLTDTNIITDLNNANILKEFINLDNVYISDLIKNDEINKNTCNEELINKIKIITSTSNQIKKVMFLIQKEKKLSTYDLLNFVIAKDKECILATGDNRLKIFSEKNGIEVLRTLKIITMMKDINIISIEKTLIALRLLLKNPNTRIPKDNIIALIKDIKKEKLTKNKI